MLTEIDEFGGREAANVEIGQKVEISKHEEMPSIAGPFSIFQIFEKRRANTWKCNFCIACNLGKALLKVLVSILEHKKYHHMQYNMPTRELQRATKNLK